MPKLSFNLCGNTKRGFLSAILRLADELEPLLKSACGMIIISLRAIMIRLRSKKLCFLGVKPFLYSLTSSPCCRTESINDIFSFG